MGIPLEFYRDNPDDAVRLLAKHLRRGSLMLFLGAGVSRPLGLPSWADLVGGCVTDAGGGVAALPTNASAKDLRLAMDQIESTYSFDDYLALVKKNLYHGVKFTEDIVTQKLLIAIGALTMGSRRGSVRNVVTLNFDDVLERYLALHGFTTQIVTSLPPLLYDTDLTIYHANGFVPSGSEPEPSSFLVFSEQSFEKRMSPEGNAWRGRVAELLASRVGLFIGLSGDDPVIGPTLQEVKSLVGTRPTGFWMLGPSPELKDDYFLARNVVPLKFPAFDDYPAFIFSICQAAATASGKVD